MVPTVPSWCLVDDRRRTNAYGTNNVSLSFSRTTCLSDPCFSGCHPVVDCRTISIAVHYRTRWNCKEPNQERCSWGRASQVWEKHFDWSRFSCRLYGEAHQKHRGTLLIDSVVCTLLSERKLGPHIHGILPQGRLEEFVEVSADATALLDRRWTLLGRMFTSRRSSRSGDFQETRSTSRWTASIGYALGERTSLAIS